MKPSLIRLTPLGRLLRLPAALLAIALVYLHMRLWGRASFDLFSNGLAGAFALAALYLASIPVHEFLHVFGFRRFGGAPSGSTRVHWVGLSAYSHCDVAMPVNAYRAAVALPGAVLGLLPVSLGLITGHPWSTLYGALMTASAIGDARVLIALRGVPAGSTVQFVTERGGYEVAAQP